MPERDLDARLDAVERTLTDGDTDLSELQDAADVVDDVSDLESRIADLESRIDELEAGLQAVRGYAGNVRAVNREVERRASAALAKAETLETAVEDAEGLPGETSGQAQSSSTPQQESPSRSGAPVDNPLGNDRSRGDSARTQRTPDTPEQVDRAPEGQIRSQRGHDESVDSAESPDDSDGSQTEQFIERVRDAL